jgi:hypothetical protein
MNKKIKIEEIYLKDENCYTQLLQSAIETLLKGLHSNYEEKRLAELISNNSYASRALLYMADLNRDVYSGSFESSN